MLENKTIYIRDLRNWRRGDYYDGPSPNDTPICLLESQQPFEVLRVVADRRCTGDWTGLLPAKVRGHLHTIRIPKCIVPDQLLQLHFVGVWGVQTKKLLAMWKWKDPDDNVTCFATSPEGVRVVIGSESGQLEMYNYACGYRVFSFLHPCKGRPSVNAVVFIEATGDGPPLCVAA